MKISYILVLQETTVETEQGKSTTCFHVGNLSVNRFMTKTYLF